MSAELDDLPNDPWLAAIEALNWAADRIEAQRHEPGFAYAAELLRAWAKGLAA